MATILHTNYIYPPCLGLTLLFFSLMFYSLCEHMFIPCLETANIHYIYAEFIIRVEEFSWNLRVGYETWLWRI